MLASILIERITDKCGDSSFSNDDKLALINECRQLLAEEIDLPLLITSDTVTTSVASNSVSLPSSYHKELFWVSSTNQGGRIGSRKADYHDISPMLKAYPALDTEGVIRFAVVDGNNLVYQGQADDTLTLRFYQMVTSIVTADIAKTDGGQPIELPEYLQESLLKNYALTEMFDNIEDLAEGPKGNSMYYEKRFLRAKMKLQEYADKAKVREPVFIRGMR